MFLESVLILGQAVPWSSAAIFQDIFPPKSHQSSHILKVHSNFHSRKSPHSYNFQSNEVHKGSEKGKAAPLLMISKGDAEAKLKPNFETKKPKFNAKKPNFDDKLKPNFEAKNPNFETKKPNFEANFFYAK